MVFWECLYQHSPNRNALFILTENIEKEYILSIWAHLDVVLNTGSLCWHKDLIDWIVMLALAISAHFALFLNMHRFCTYRNQRLIKALALTDSHRWASRSRQPCLFLRCCYQCLLCPMLCSGAVTPLSSFVCPTQCLECTVGNAVSKTLTGSPSREGHVS